MPPLTKTDVERLSQLYLDVINSHNLDRFGEILADNYVNHTRMGTVEGLENFKQFMVGIYSAFPDIQWFEDDTVAEGNLIAYHYHWTGTHQGELTGIPATGKQVTVYGMEMDRFENGKMVETWNYADAMGLMQQLGVIPGPG